MQSFEDQRLSDAIDVVDMLEGLGMRNISDLGMEVRFSCPFPGHANGDKNPSCCMNKDSTLFICYGCDERGNAITFVSKYGNISPALAKRFLNERYVGGWNEPGQGIAVELAKRFPINTGPAHPPLLRPDASHVKRFDVDWNAFDPETMPNAAMRYILGRGLNKGTLRCFEVGYDHLSDRLTIPVYGGFAPHLLGFKARAWWPDAHPKYLILGGDRYGFEPYHKNEVLFGSWISRTRTDRIVITEGELDAMKLFQLGYTALAIGGSSMSEQQLRDLRRLPLANDGEVVLFFDEDDAGRRATREIGEVLNLLTRVSVAAQHAGDPMSMDFKDVHECILRAEGYNARSFSL